MRDWLSHRVVSSPDDTALVRAEDGETWTYAELDRLVSETAGRLAARGIGPGDHIGVLMPAYVGTVGVVHAAMRLGATYVPLGERLTPRELTARVERADLSVLVCAESTESDAVAAVDDVPVLSVDEPIEDEVIPVHGVDPEPVDRPEWTFDDRLCLLFTSGTTGDPKPVELTAGNVYASAVASAFRLGVDADDRWLVALSLHHMGGLASIYRSTLYGTTVALREEFKPGRTADDIDTYEITGVSLVPTMLRKTLDRRGTLADSLRVVLLGGAPASEELIGRCRNYSIPVHPTYGMTEAASQIATATPAQTRDRPGTVGRPLFGTDVTVVDDGEPVDPGDTGEIVVDGPTIAPGYYGLPDITAERFGPYGLHTGDVGRLDENGYLHVLNRLDDRIITGGENVEPGEVSTVLANHPAIDEAAVVGLEDDVWGERVAALVEVDPATIEIGSSDANGVDDSETDDGVDDATDGDPGVDPAAEGDDDSGTDEEDDVDEEEANGGENGSAAGEAEDDAIGGDDMDGEGDASDDDDTGSDGDVDGDDADGNAFDADASEPGDRDDLAPSSGAGRSPSALRDEVVSFARDRLAGFKLPRTIAFTEEIPRTVSGTVDRQAVRRVLGEHGHEIGTPDEPFDRAGFEPADPEPVDGEASDAEHDRKGTDDDGTASGDDSSPHGGPT